MQNGAPRFIERPAYLLESVDNALRLLQTLRDTGPLRLKEAAEELDIAASTAHRLLAMLVYRGFAIQDEARCYHPGPALGAPPARGGWMREFTEVCRPELETLARTCGETVHLVIRTGTDVRFLWSRESTAMLRVGDRRGQILPAELTAGGRILLAHLSDDELQRLYLRSGADSEAPLTPAPRQMPSTDFILFRRELAAARAAGYAVNMEKTEEGVAAIGVAVYGAGQRAVGAVTVAVPVVRFERHGRGSLVRQMTGTARRLQPLIGGITA